MTPPSPSSCSIASTVCTAEPKDYYLESVEGKFYIKLKLSVAENELFDVPPSCDSWTITAGDTLAISCTESTTPYRTLPPKKNKNKWFPFATPWAPAQVLAIYKSIQGDWMMKIRWLYWHDDLKPPLNKQLPKRKNQVLEHYHVQTCEAGAALGRICLDSSSFKSSKRRPVLGIDDGMPVVHLKCQHAVTLNDKETLQEVHDWNGQPKAQLSALKRGLSYLPDDGLRNDTLRQLQERGYAMTTAEAQATNTDEESQGSEHGMTQDEPKTPRSVVTNSSSSNTSSVQDEEPFFQQDDIAYYWKLPVQVQLDAYAKSIFLPDDQHQDWTVQVGDLVAVQHDDSSKPSFQKNPWFPFSQAWSPAQILALSYSEEDGYMVHVRWLYRYKDFQLEEASDQVKKYLNMDRKSKLATKMVYEHDVYNVEDLESILGRVVLTSSDIVEDNFWNNVQGEDGIPQAPLICRCLLSEDLQEVTRIDDWNIVHTSRRNQLKRGMVDCLSDDQGLYDATLEMLNDSSNDAGSASLPSRSEPLSLLSAENSEPAVNEDGNEEEEEASRDEEQQFQPPSLSNDAMRIIDDDHIGEPAEEDHRPESSQSTDTAPVDENEEGGNQVPMDEEESSNVVEPLSPKRRGRGKKRTDPESSQNLDEHAPSPAKRRRSARTSEHSAAKSSEVKEPSSSAKRKRRSPGLSSPGSEEVDGTSSSRVRRSPRLSDGERQEAKAVSSSRKRRSTRRSSRNKKGPTTSEKAKAVNGGLFDLALGSFVTDGGIGTRSDARTKRSSVPTRSDSDASSESSESEEEEEEGRIFIPNGLRPFHQDFGALRSYYSEIDVMPDTARSAVPIPPESRVERWTVKMGDVVVVQYKQGADKSNEPFTVSSAVAEVVAIWKEHESVDAMRLFNHENSRATVDTQDDIKIEIRWFYRKNELPGSAKSTTATDNATKLVEYEQIFETDLMDECGAESLLASAELLETSARLGPRKFRNGMPLEEFQCCQFWSIHRKSLMPISNLDGRIERGRMHSKYLGKGGALSVAWREFNSNDGDEVVHNEEVVQSMNWRQAFRGVIENLGLSASSERSSVQGLELTGREKEQEKIMTFLRSRIIGASDCGEASGSDSDEAESTDSRVAMNASLFVAGPPGTGKTASVLSVITRLRNEQAKGELPAFDFVSLNGMEMRHPFEAYIKFWEMISGNKKQKCPPEVAVAKLERHFAGRGQNGGDKISPVVVLLLDEIDYLVTKKQTVLYNFFDWPRRTMENGAGPRLVVVGISNTLNLPSRLKPSVQSRLGGEICGYKSYNVKDMVAILKTKIQSDKARDYQVFEDDAIQFAARKTAALSGDIRKALHVCKAAAEMVMKDVEAGTRVDPKQGQGGPIVRISDVQRASRESFSSILSKAVAFSTSFEALVLVSLASLTQSTGRQDGGFDINELITKMEALSGGSGDVQYAPAPSFGETLEILNRLGETRLVSLHTPKSSTVTFRAAQGGSGGAWPLISLPMDSSNLRKALRDTPHSTLADKYIASY